MTKIYNADIIVGSKLDDVQFTFKNLPIKKIPISILTRDSYFLDKIKKLVETQATGAWNKLNLKKGVPTIFINWKTELGVVNSDPFII